MSEKNELREKIIETANTQFQTHGIKEVKMDDIAAALGISKRTLYQLFKDKEELLYESIRYGHKLSVDKAKQLIRNASDTMDVILSLYNLYLRQMKVINKNYFRELKKYPKVVEERVKKSRQNEHKVRAFKLPEGETLNFRSGGYIQIDIPQYDEIKFSDMDIDEKFREDWDKFKMWDLVTKNPEPTFRAYSMANHPAEGNIIMLNIRIATPPFDRVNGGFMKVNPGICSSYVFSRKPGDKVTISGPYGEFFLDENLPDTQELIFIGGGAGMAPMRSHLMHLFKTEKTKRPVSFWYGARALKEAPYMDEFHQIEEEFPNFKMNLALDRPDPEADAAGVAYTAGFVHNVLYENYLKNHEAPEDCIYLMCGPPMMIGAVVNMLDSLGVPPENILYDNFGS